MCYYLIYINVELIDDIIIIAITLIISIINIPSVLRLILIQPIIQWIPYCSLQLHNCSVGAQELCGLQGWIKIQTRLILIRIQDPITLLYIRGTGSRRSSRYGHGRECGANPIWNFNHSHNSFSFSKFFPNSLHFLYPPGPKSCLTHFCGVQRFFGTFYTLMARETD